MHFKPAEKLSKLGVEISKKWIHLVHSPGQYKKKFYTKDFLYSLKNFFLFKQKKNWDLLERIDHPKIFYTNPKNYFSNEKKLLPPI